jgi:tetratricopeptide (TPR) repeat protein
MLFASLAFSQDITSSDKKKDIITDSKLLIQKGNKLYDKGLYADAEASYQEALVLNPDYDKANYNFGNTQFLQNKMKEAKTQYDMVSKMTKDKFVKADSYHNLGNIDMKSKNYAAAIDAYKNSLRNNPKDDDTRYNLALAKKLLKDQQQKDDKKKDDKKDDKKKDKDKKNKDNKDKKDNKNDKDKKNDKNKDKDKKDDKDNKDKDKKDQKDNKDDKGKNDKKDQNKPQPKPSKLSPEQVKQLLEAMNKEENKTQKKMNAKKERGRKVKQDKDW